MDKDDRILLNQARIMAALATLVPDRQVYLGLMEESRNTLKAVSPYGGSDRIVDDAWKAEPVSKPAA